MVNLKQKINSKVNDFLNGIDNKKIDEADKRDEIWSEFSGNLSEMEKHINIINYFVYLKDGELINEFPIESINVLKKAIKSAEHLLTVNNYTDRELFRYGNCIDDGYRVLNTSTVLTTLKMTT